jgi:peptidoglycan/xylan/chitin deacetylase (PgdA/CDA1 family)
MATEFTFSVDDGHPSDMKMAELLSKHHLNGTFYVPISNCEGYDVMSPQQLREIGRQFEIGAHTYDHRLLINVDVREAYYQIAEGSRKLEDLLGKEVVGFCYPGGKYGKKDVKLVQACGFKYARTTMNLRFDAGDQPFEMPTTVQFFPHDRSVYFRNFGRSGKWLRRHAGLRLALRYGSWIDRLYALFDHACNHGRTFHLWSHSWEIDKLNAWRELDRFLAYVATRVAVQDRVNNKQLAARHFGFPQKRLRMDLKEVLGRK